MIKSIYTPKIHSIQNINCLLMESKHQLLINGRGKVGIENLKNQKASIDYSRTIDNVYENLEDYNPIEKTSVNRV